MKGILIFFQLLAFSVNVYSNVFVSITGNDTFGNGKIDNPYLTLSKASFKAVPGDTIYIRGGTFSNPQFINGNNGTLNQKITIMPFMNESVIFDGKISGINEYQGLITISRHFYNLSSIKIINSPGYGIYYTGCNYLKISNCEIHSTYSSIIRGWGDNDTIENCVFINNVLKNELGALCKLGKGWPAGIACGYDNTGTIFSNNFIFKNNKLSRTWGEAIYLIGCLDCKVENNEIFNNFSVNIAIGRSKNIKVQNNYVYTTNDSLNRPDLNARANGIYMANEMNIPDNNIFVDSVLIANNIIAGCKAGIRFWLDQSNKSDSNTYSHVSIFYNDFYDIIDRIINIDSIPSGLVQPEGNLFINNIAFKSISESILRNPRSWTVTNNNFVGSIPSFASHPTNFTENPLMINPVNGGDVNGFKLQNNSPCKGKGVNIMGITTDFLDKIRDNNSPTVGALEIEPTNTIIELATQMAEITISPNPASDYITLGIPPLEKMGLGGVLEPIRIFNTFGEYVLTVETQNFVSLQKIDISALPAGVYFVRIGDRYEKFVKINN